MAIPFSSSSLFLFPLPHNSARELSPRPSDHAVHLFCYFWLEMLPRQILDEACLGAVLHRLISTLADSSTLPHITPAFVLRALYGYYLDTYM